MGGVLFVHNNFPGQFRDLAQVLVARGVRCVAISQSHAAEDVPGVPSIKYALPRGTTFGIMPLRRERFIAAIHARDPRADKARLTLRDFDRKPFIMYSADGAGYSFRIITAMFEKAEVNPKYVHHLDQNHTILSLVSAGLGAALVPDSLAMLAVPNVVFKPVKIDPPDPLEMFMAWRPENRNPALAPFLALCRTLFDPAARR